MLCGRHAVSITVLNLIALNIHPILVQVFCETEVVSTQVIAICQTC